MEYITQDGYVSTTPSFSKEEYKKHDHKKIIAIKYFENLGCHAEETKKLGYADSKDVDLLVTVPDGRKFYCDVETKNNWTGPYFTFPDVQCVVRKNKFVGLLYPFLLFMLNREFTHALLIKGEDMINSPTREVKNRMQKRKNKKIKKDEPEPERFSIVQLNKVKFIELKVKI